MPLPLQVAFVAGSSGIWRIERITAVAGESLPPAERLAVIEGPEALICIDAIALDYRVNLYSSAAKTLC
jgi:hypothetical protein